MDLKLRNLMAGSWLREVQLTLGLTQSDHYEAVTRKILHDLREHLGLDRVEGEAKYIGHRSGTEWKIEATGYRVATGALVLVECRRYSERRVEQEEVAAFAYRIGDIGADGGLIVTPIGLQRGAQLVAGAERIGVAMLNAEATETNYALEIAGQLFRGLGVFDNASLKDSVQVCVIVPITDSGNGQDSVSVEKRDADATSAAEQAQVEN